MYNLYYIYWMQSTLNVASGNTTIVCHRQLTQFYSWYLFMPDILSLVCVFFSYIYQTRIHAHEQTHNGCAINTVYSIWNIFSVILNANFCHHLCIFTIVTRIFFFCKPDVSISAICFLEKLAKFLEQRSCFILLAVKTKTY